MKTQKKIWVNSRGEQIELAVGEVVEDLQCDGLKLLQRDDMFKFGIDSVLLANFVRAPANSTIIELCAGSGVISILMSSKTGASRIIGIELNDKFVEMAKRSIAINGLEGKIEIISGDIREYRNHFKKGAAGSVAVNPPYMKLNSGAKSDDALKAAAKHETTCNLKDVVEAAAFLLRQGGRFFIVYRPQRLVDLFCLMREYSIEPKYIRPVCAKHGQKPVLVLVEGKKSASSELIFQPPLYIYNEVGEHISREQLETLSHRSE